MTMYDHILRFMAMYDNVNDYEYVWQYICLLMTMYDFVSLYIPLNDLYDHVWLCITIYNLIWLYDYDNV